MIRLTAVIEDEGKAPRAISHESSAPVITIGRDSQSDFQLPLTTISRQHCKIYYQDQTYLIEDLKSTHGTVLNSKRLEPNEKKVLSDGDTINIAKAKITVAISSDQMVLADPGEKTQAVAAKAVEEILGRMGGGNNQDEGPFLRVLNGADEGTRFVLGSTSNQWTVGRSKECAFIINDQNISRRHAIVRKDWDGISIEDLGSKNGVIVNERKIAKKKLLRHRDEIKIGPVKLLYIDPDHELINALQDIPGFETEDDDEPEEEIAASAEDENTDDDEQEDNEPSEVSVSEEGDNSHLANSGTDDEPDDLDFDPDDLPEDLLSDDLLRSVQNNSLTTIIMIIGAICILLIMAILIVLLL